MKTPREILLQRRANLQPRLDGLRAATVASLTRPAQGSPRERAWWRIAAHEIFGCASTAWAGIAVVALLALGLNLAVPVSRTPSAGPAGPAPRISQALRERSQILADLNQRAGGQETDLPMPLPGRTVAPQPTRKTEGRRSSLDHTSWVA